MCLERSKMLKDKHCKDIKKCVVIKQVLLKNKKLEVYSVNKHKITTNQDNDKRHV